MATFYNWVVAGASREDHVGHVGTWLKGRRIPVNADEWGMDKWSELLGGAPKTKRQGLRSSLRLAWDEYSKVSSTADTVDSGHAGVGAVEPSGTKDEAFRVIRTTSVLRRTMQVDGVWLEPLEEEDELLVRKFRGPTAEVSASGGLTVKLADYESARIDVGVKIPCYLEEIDEVSSYAAKHVADKIDQDIEVLVGVRSDPGRIASIADADANPVELQGSQEFDGEQDDTISDNDVVRSKEDSEESDSGEVVQLISWGESKDIDGEPLF